MKRVPAYRKSIVKADLLLAKYATSAGLLDALHAMAILPPSAPTLTELVLSHLRSERGFARARPPLALGELFDLRLARYAPLQTRSIASLQCARRFLCGRLGEDRVVDTILEEDIASALNVYADPQSFNSVFRRLRLTFNWAIQSGFIDRSPMGSLTPRRVDWREPVHFLPDRVERIFRISEKHPGSLAAAVGMQLALGFFAGVRTAEIYRARWEDLDLDGALLRVPRPKGFTSGHKPRLVELEPCAVAWMRRWRDWTISSGGCASGLIVPNPRRFALWKRDRLAPSGDSWGNVSAHKISSDKSERNAKGKRRTTSSRTAQCETTDNCRSGNVMRHTYATMHVAAFRDAAATALNLGHSGGTELLEKHYRGIVPKAIADDYWRILPSSEPLPPPEPDPGRGFRSDLKPRS